MFLNIKYAYYSLIKNTYTTILSIIQLSICFVFLYFIINQSISTLTEMQKFSSVLDEKKIYSFDLIDEMDILGSNEKFNKIRDFYQEITNSYNGKLSLCSDSHLQLQSFLGIDQFAAPGGLEVDYSWVRTLSIDYKFVDQYDLKLSKGKNFTKDDFFIEKNKPIPVIVGSEYENFFQIGDIINYKNQYGGNIKEIQISGFLKKGSIFISDAGIINLGSYIIFPFQPIENTIGLTSNDPDYNNMTSFLQLSLLRDEIFGTDNYNDFIEINNKIKSEGLHNLIQINDLSGFQDQLMNEFKKSVSNQLLGTGISIIFVTIGLIFNSLNKIKSRYIELGVHISYGCKVTSLFYRILIEFLLLSIISFIASAIFIIVYAKFGTIQFEGLINYVSLIILFIFSIILGFIIAIPSAIKIKKISVIQLVRR